MPHYRLLRNKINRKRKRCRKTYYNKKIRDLQNVRPRDWWHEVKRFCGISTRKRQDLLTILKTNTESSDQKLANCINEAFLNAIKDYEPLENNIYVQCDDHESLTVDEKLKIKKLQQINTSKASGPDNMPNLVLKTFFIF